MNRLKASLRQAVHYRPRMGGERLILWVTLGFTLFYNFAFWQQTLASLPFDSLHDGAMLLGLLIVMTSLQFVVFLLFANRRIVRPVLSVLILVAACVSYFTAHYGTYFDTSMIDNLLQTDTREAGELVTTGLLLHLLLFAAIPIALIWRVRIAASSWQKALLRRLAYLSGGILVLVASIMLTYPSLSPLMRNDKELRYLVTPGNYLVSMGQALAAGDQTAVKQRQPIGLDATRTAPQRERPSLLVIVVGETLRAANWGLDGYARQTTPQLARRNDVINYPHVTSCGTSTAVSLPCMFSPVGHDDYDKAYIEQHESLLDVLKHAGVDVIWLDNQSGCKGVCDGVASHVVTATDAPALCQGEHCMDEALVEALKSRLDTRHADTVIVLHQLGNHGPSYYQRYPQALRKFTPTCDTAELSRCSREAIVNSYDNAALYTDQMLNRLIDYLAHQQSHEAAMIYVSDHGESLGEHGLYLHGVPYAIAPQEQTHVPMIWWLSPEFARDQGIDTACLGQAAGQPVSHDNLFHSVLGMLDVSTSLYDPELDISRPCR
ncbi:phosphoethanolamine--lipid A transferase [Halomonas shantousis]